MDDTHTGSQRDLALVVEKERLLSTLQDLLQQASQAADAAARQNIFSRHRRYKSDHTKRLHRYALGCFMTYLAAVGIELAPLHLADEPRLWQGIGFGLVEGFVLWMEGERYSVKTMHDYLSVVKLYAGLAHQANMMDTDTFTDIKELKALSGAEAEHLTASRLKRREKPRGRKKAQATYIEPDQVEQLFDLPDNAQGRRDRVALMLLYELGLRPGEAVMLRLSNLHLDEASPFLRFKRLKTYEEQEIELTDHLIEALSSYLDDRNDWRIYQRDPTRAEYDAPLLVQSLKNHTLVEQCDMRSHTQDRRYLHAGGGKTGAIPSADWSTQSLYAYVRRLASKLGFPSISPYDGRHQWARDAADSGTLYIHMLQAGGWKPGSRMPERYYGRPRVERSQVKLSVRTRKNSDKGNEGIQ